MIPHNHRQHRLRQLEASLPVGVERHRHRRPPRRPGHDPPLHRQELPRPQGDRGRAARGLTTDRTRRSATTRTAPGARGAPPGRVTPLARAHRRRPPTSDASSPTLGQGRRGRGAGFQADPDEVTCPCFYPAPFPNQPGKPASGTTGDEDGARLARQFVHQGLRNHLAQLPADIGRSASGHRFLASLGSSQAPSEAGNAGPPQLSGVMSAGYLPYCERPCRRTPCRACASRRPPVAAAPSLRHLPTVPPCGPAQARQPART